MCSAKRLLALALILLSAAACSDPHTSPGSAKSAAGNHKSIGDFDDSDVYRYYGGPSAASQKSDVQRRQDAHMTERR